MGMNYINYLLKNTFGNAKATAYAKQMFKSGYSEEFIDADMLSKYSVAETKQAIEKAKLEILNSRK